MANRLAVAVYCLALMASGARVVHPQTVFFEETFNGPLLNSTRWRTDDLTAGPRWCGSTPGSPALPGFWIDPEVTPCVGQLSVPPHGSAFLDAGLLRISAPIGSKTILYLSSRLPGGVLLFPEDGDFRLKVRMRYDQFGGCGDGLLVVKWDDTTPSGNNASITASNIVFQIWGDAPGIRILTSLRGTHEQLPVAIQGQSQFHDYEVVCERSTYTFLIDGEPVFGPAPNTDRPTAVWLGNPTVSYSGCQDWSAFSVDFIRVDVDAPISTGRSTWADLKAHYR